MNNVELSVIEHLEAYKLTFLAKKKKAKKPEHVKNMGLSIHKLQKLHPMAYNRMPRLLSDLQFNGHIAFGYELGRYTIL